MPNIEIFKNRFKNLARMNRFKVSGFGFGDNISFFAKGANLPAAVVPAMDVNYQGRIIKLDGDRTYEPFELTVYGDENMAIRKQFERMSEAYNDPIQNAGTMIKVDGFITLLNRDDSISTRYQFFGSLITNVASVALDWGTNDSPLEFTVTIDYDYHLIVT